MTELEAEIAIASKTTVYLSNPQFRHTPLTIIGWHKTFPRLVVKVRTIDGSTPISFRISDLETRCHDDEA